MLKDNIDKQDNQAALESGSWARLHGRVEKEGDGRNTNPVLQVERIENVEKPEAEYVYFYFK